jgi:hypothetical protein
MRVFLLSIASLLSLVGQSALAQSPTETLSKGELTSFIQDENELLARFHLTPIIVSRAERVGDNFDRQIFNLIAGADDCFPGLKVRQDAGQLPSITTYSERGLSAALGASGLLDAAADTRLKRVYVLSFKDVEVRTASIVQLRNAISKKAIPECEIVRPYLQALSLSKRHPKRCYKKTRE